MTSSTTTSIPATTADPAARPTLGEAPGAADRTDDIAAIEAVIAGVELGFNTKDPEPAIAAFATDSLVVNAVGAAVSGWDAIEEAHRAGLAGFLKDEYVRYQIDQITFVRPDVAIALKSARATDRDGTLLDDEPAMRAIYTLVRDGGRWWIAARGNTLVVR